MEFAQPLIEGRLVRRYKRFLADVELADGARITAHCPNPGAMTTCMVVGGRVWLSLRENQTRKLPYTWELAEVDQSLVCVNTARANDVVAEALQAGAIAELCDYREMAREVRYGDNSRVDFLLREPGARACYVEVKSVTLAAGERTAAFPDSVTTRGSKHLRELCNMVAAGHRAVLLFVCNRTNVDRVRPADEIDPVYGYTLRRARAAGVELLCYRAHMDARGMAIAGRIPISLPAFEYIPPAPRRATASARIRRGAKKQLRSWSFGETAQKTSQRR